MANTKYERAATAELESKGSVSDTKKYSMLWRTGNALMTIFFVLCSYVQINDPDPFFWLPAYMAPALLTFSIAIKPHVTENTIWRWLCVVHMAICIIASVFYISIVAERLMEKTYNPLEDEEGREVGGLVIIIVWLFICRFTSVGSPLDSTRSSLSGLLMLTCLLSLIPLVMWLFCFVEGMDQQLGHCKDMFPGLLGSKSEL